jgi:hypothetical protein
VSTTTSGTVNQYYFGQRQVIEHAARRAGYSPQNLTPEWLMVIRDLLFLQLSEYVNAGLPLWTQEFLLLGATVGSPDVPTPPGTVDVLHTYWRILQPYRGTAQTSTGTSAAALFGGQPNPDVTIAGTNPGVIVSFGSSTEVDTVGILLGGSSPLTAALQVQTAPDGVTWTTVQTLPTATYTPQQWTYFDLNPSVTTSFIQIVSPGSNPWTLNQINLGLANGQDIEIGPLNIDDYYGLPNKFFQGDQANSAYLFRNRDQPIVKVWPTLNLQGWYNGTVSVLAHRYIQDPGQMTNSLEIPSRWFEGVVARLGIRIMDELPDPDSSAQASYFTLMAKTQKRQILETAAAKAEALMWSEERTRAPIRININLSPYTR